MKIFLIKKINVQHLNIHWSWFKCWAILHSNIALVTFRHPIIHFRLFVFLFFYLFFATWIWYVYFHYYPNFKCILTLPNLWCSINLDSIMDIKIQGSKLYQISIASLEQNCQPIIKHQKSSLWKFCDKTFITMTPCKLSN